MTTWAEKVSMLEKILKIETFPLGAKIIDDEKVQRSFDAGEALKLIHEKKVNTIFFVSTMWLFMSQHNNFEETDMSGLRLAWTGGAPCPHIAFMKGNQ